jgi:hypothetical protein
MANQQQAAQQKAQQTAQDPIVQMQQAELQLKVQELELKNKKLITDAAREADKLQIERERIAAQKEIAGMQVGAKVATDKATLSAKEQEAGLRLGVEIARDTMQPATKQETPKKAPKEQAE